MRCRCVMFYKFTSSRLSTSRHKGFSLPAAIFILVVMALLAAAAVNLLNKGLKGVTQEVLSTRAFYSAESGAQYVLGQLFSLSGGVANCAASSSLNYSATGLAGCSSSMTCSSRSIGSVLYYSINSTGVCSSGSDRAVRQIELLARAP